MSIAAKQGISLIEFLIISVVLLIIALFMLPKAFNSNITDDKINSLDAISSVSSAYKTCKLFAKSAELDCSLMSDVVEYLEYKDIEELNGKIIIKSGVIINYDPNDKINDGSSVTIVLPDEKEKKIFTLYLMHNNDIALSSTYRGGIMGGIVAEDTYDPFK